MKGIIFTIALIALVSCSSNSKNSNEKKAMLFYAHGTEQLLSKNYTDALKNLSKANKIKPNDSKILNNLGMAYYFKGRPHQALDLIKDSLEVNPKNSDARNNLASIYFSLRKYDQAEKQYNLILDDLTYRHVYRVHYNLGLIDLKKNDIRSSIKNFERASGLHVNYCAANFQLAVLHQRMKKYSKAAEWYKKAGRGDCKSNPKIYYYWAGLLAELGKDEEAVEKYEYVIEEFENTRYAKDAKRKKKLLDKDSVRFANKVEKIETINSGDF